MLQFCKISFLTLAKLLRWLVGKDSACNAGATGHAGSIPGLGRSPGEGHGNLVQQSCLENPMDRGILVGYGPWGRKESDMTEAT